MGAYWLYPQTANISVGHLFSKIDAALNVLGVVQVSEEMGNSISSEYEGSYSIWSLAVPIDCRGVFGKYPHRSDRDAVTHERESNLSESFVLLGAQEERAVPFLHSSCTIFLPDHPLRQDVTEQVPT